MAPADGKGGVTLTLDAMQSARHVILSAGKASQVYLIQSVFDIVLQKSISAQICQRILYYYL